MQRKPKPKKGYLYLTYLVLTLVFYFNQVSAQTTNKKFNYKQGSVTLKNGKTIYGNVANIKHGFRDQLLDKIRIKPNDKSLSKKYRPSKISGFSMGDRKFVSWRVKRNNALLKEAYSIHSGKKHKVFELQSEGYLSIYLEYFLDDDLQIQSVPFFLKRDETIMVRATQGVFGLKRKFLSDYFADCPQLVDLIDENSITSPDEVATFYNNFKEEQLKLNR
ncbi:hypothetical protein MM236_00655 [Belliella sp. DSM 107340]|uniref:DUF4468 domain-containing protein n=1 Tax=Belliella calami TaxID=2923436 RepID=A0ABS9UIM2_9BACT|nr:hypothetical protein [Belliella calami]MCH7396469.1 hypothetical protein [Belliella calami]